MKLSELLKDIIQTDLDVEISGLCLHASQVQPGDVFIALQGQNVHGIDYLDQAINNGAVAVLVDSQTIEASIPSISIDQLGQHLSTLAKRYYANAAQVEVIGITGTNGKTSTAYFITQLLTNLGVNCATIGTLGIEKSSLTSIHTTPDLITLYRALDGYHQQGITHAVLEVSSHALDQDRIQGLNVVYAVFTNLTQDHLDYHKDLESYQGAKAKLFTRDSVKHVILNQADNYAQTLSDLAAGKAQHNYHTDEFELAQANEHGFLMQWAGWVFELPLLGEFNLANVLASVKTAQAMGFELSSIVPQLTQLMPPPGRMQQISNQSIWVDYAHTPDAIKQAILTLKAHFPNRHIRLIFGCGGERDQDKRAQMGKIATTLADSVILTNDNPRSEDPEAIIADIQKGIAEEVQAEVILDRQLAIENTVRTLKEDECLLIAGKGHETTQVFADHVLEFSDIEIAKHAAH